MKDTFRLDSVVNSMYMGKDYVNRHIVHENRPSHGLVYIKHGKKLYSFKNGNEIRVSGGCFIYLPRFSDYVVRRDSVNGETEDYSEVYCVNILCTDNAFGEGEYDDRAFAFHVKREAEMESIYKKIIREMYLKKPYYELRVTSLVYELVHLIFTERHSEYYTTEVESRLSPALNYINENYIGNDLKISELSAMCGMSENYFRRLFTRVYGKSPVKYITERRIAYATEFLKSGLYTVTESAMLSGFDDIGYFSRTYKKITGESPSQTLHGEDIK
ncbi:MAG: helix-turn-helix transcriptional regulator [Clostridia bacterium]|nr:helix-turn-helix transcriptional regulator [Clostridia bacterium]